MVRELERLVIERGKPKMVVSDNGGEFTSSSILGARGGRKIGCDVFRLSREGVVCHPARSISGTACAPAATSAGYLADSRHTITPRRDRVLKRGAFYLARPKAKGSGTMLLEVRRGEFLGSSGGAASFAACRGCVLECCGAPRRAIRPFSCGLPRATIIGG